MTEADHDWDAATERLIRHLRKAECQIAVIWIAACAWLFVMLHLCPPRWW